MNDIKTAGIIIIGNEILSGKVHDSNSFYLASELWSLGIHVHRISVIPDEIGIIAKEAYESRYTYVFTTGGVGPTHDDVTMAGIAEGFKVRLAKSPQILKFLSERFGDNMNEAVLKMSEIPEGAEVLMYAKMRFPVVSFRNIYIFPGIPEYVRNKFPIIREKFGSSPFFIRRIFLRTHESLVAQLLADVVCEHREVSVGSYPVVTNPEYSVIITLESKLKEPLDKAFEDLRSRLEDSIIVKTE
jgi:molybdenum cofactor synthesis domain-containing protein